MGSRGRSAWQPPDACRQSLTNDSSHQEKGKRSVGKKMDRGEAGSVYDLDSLPDAGMAAELVHGLQIGELCAECRARILRFSPPTFPREFAGNRNGPPAEFPVNPIHSRHNFRADG